MPRALKILVVDDIPLMRTMIVKYIEAVGRRIEDPASENTQFRCIEAPNGRVALETLEGTAVDVIFLDMMMPELDGIAFLEKRRKIPTLREIPVIVSSAFEELELIEKARELGAIAYLQKPFGLNALETELSRAIRSIVPRGQPRG